MTGQPARQPADYVHGDCVIIPQSVAAWLNDEYLLELRMRVLRDTEAEVYSVLGALVLGAKKYRLSDEGSLLIPEAEPATQWLSADRAAGLIGISSRAVRAAIAKRTLRAEMFDGRWKIDRAEAEHYRIARQNRAR